MESDIIGCTSYYFCLFCFVIYIFFKSIYLFNKFCIYIPISTRLSTHPFMSGSVLCLSRTAFPCISLCHFLFLISPAFSSLSLLALCLPTSSLNCLLTFVSAHEYFNCLHGYYCTCISVYPGRGDQPASETPRDTSRDAATHCWIGPACLLF